MGYQCNQLKSSFKFQWCLKIHHIWLWPRAIYGFSGFLSNWGCHSVAHLPQYFWPYTSCCILVGKRGTFPKCSRWSLGRRWACQFHMVNECYGTICSSILLSRVQRNKLEQKEEEDQYPTSKTLSKSMLCFSCLLHTTFVRLLRSCK